MGRRQGHRSGTVASGLVLSRFMALDSTLLPTIVSCPAHFRKIRNSIQNKIESHSLENVDYCGTER